MNNTDELKELIRAGSVKNVAEFGGNKLGLPAPYAVITPGPAAPDRQAYQVWAHFPIGMNKEIEEYVKVELPALIGAAKNNCGQRKYKSNGTYDGVGVDAADNTLRAGKVFYTPLIFG
jgi:hypothetical protein